jgi:hypothetical protein
MRHDRECEFCGSMRFVEPCERHHDEAPFEACEVCREIQSLGHLRRQVDATPYDVLVALSRLGNVLLAWLEAH